jgi:hypothetical protein
MQTRSSFYLWLTIAMTVTTFYGFSQTYFSPLFGSENRPLSSIVHLHGWSFFLWYLLLPLQAFLVRRRSVKLHRTLGGASILLAILMVASGFVVVTVRIHAASGPDSSPFWAFMGPVILATLLLFAVFYSLALHYRRQSDYHKRLMIVASAAGIGAAAFRALASVVGFHLWVPAVGIVASNLFIVAGMIRDYRVEGKVHKVYWVGLSACVVLEGLMFALPFTGVSAVLTDVLASIGESLAFLYDSESIGL